MSLKSRTFECPDCERQFSVLLDDNDAPPSYCPLCGSFVGEGATPLPSAFKIGTRAGKAPDAVYRQMEAASAKRAQEAASMLGLPAAEMSHLKMTDMKDNLRAGDVSAVSSSPKPSSQIPMGNAPASNGVGYGATPQMIQQFTQGVAQLGGSQGQAVRENLIKGHAARAKAVQREGCEGRYAG